MFMLIIYRFITGYVKFCGSGVFPERFLNLCAKDNISVWSPKINYGNISGYMRARDYKNIRSLARRSNMRLSVRKKVGVPFILNRYRHRYGIALGAVIFFVMLWYLSGFCFNITVCGNQNIKERYILTQLEKQGVFIGRRMDDIDPELTRQRFLIDNKEFSWAAINKKGSFVTVDLRETTERKMTVSSSAPCNIIASRSGKILRIKAYNGKISVMVGEAAKKGDLLVSGVVELANKATKFVHANAEVIAETEYILKVFVPYKQVVKVRTGKVYSRTVLNALGVKIPLFLGEIKPPYSVKKQTKNLEIDGIKLPFSAHTAQFVELKAKTVTVNKRQAKIQALEKCKKKAEKKLGDKIKYSSAEKFTYSEKGVFYETTYTCEENIAKPKKILK